MRPELILKAREAKAEELENLALTVRAILRKEREKGVFGGGIVKGGLVQVRGYEEAIVIGDIHGDFEALTTMVEGAGIPRGLGTDRLLIFLGDYGDRGEQSVEVYFLILALKASYPDGVVLLRGNHEGPHDLVASPHDLPYQFVERYGDKGVRLYLVISSLFDALHHALTVNGYLMLHGGAPSGAKSIDDIAYAHEKHPSETSLEEILWNDPVDDVLGTYPSPRGAGKLFGKDVTERVLSMTNCEVLIRGHEPCRKGVKVQHDGKVLTLFSRKGYPYWNDEAAYLKINLKDQVLNAYELAESAIKF
ncbi:MAG: metallophosphoesterase family protein [Candidatus Nezhaarchaeales archaeon]